MKPHYIIIGAGISGLSLAHFLRKQQPHSFDLSILEASSRPGGWIETVRQDDFLFEQGPRSCRTRGNGLETLKLAEELHLQDQIIPASPSAKNRYLYIGRQLKRLPAGPLSLLFSPFAPIILRGIWKDLRTPAAGHGDESIHSFVSRRLGPEFAEKLFDPLTLGIYAGDISGLSVKSCFPVLVEWEATYGSIIKGAFARKPKAANEESPFVKTLQKQPIFTFKSGMQALIGALADRLDGHLKLSCPVATLRPEGDRIAIQLDSGEVLQADHVFAAVPPGMLAKMMAESSPEASQLLDSIASASVGVINVGYRRKVLDKEGFGYLIPSKENEAVLGVVWDSSAFPQQNKTPEETRLTVMIGGSRLFGLSDLKSADLANMALEALAQQIGIQCEPDAIAVKLASQAIPQFEVGHSQKIQQIREILNRLYPHLTLLGSAFDGVAVNDCIAGAKALATKSII